MYKWVALNLALVAVVSADVSHLFAPPRGGRLPVAPRPSNLPVAPAQQYSQGAQIPIVRQNQDVREDGSYEYAYETGNGIAVQEQGSVRALGQDQIAQTVQGSFQYTAPDNSPIAVSYVTDENGFQPQGAHLPTPPPIPAAILRALDYLAAHPEPAVLAVKSVAAPIRRPAYPFK